VGRFDTVNAHSFQQEGFGHECHNRDQKCR
jgi:hypothetical protein